MPVTIGNKQINHKTAILVWCFVEELPVPVSDLEGVRPLVGTRPEVVDPPLKKPRDRLHLRIAHPLSPLFFPFLPLFLERYNILLKEDINTSVLLIKSYYLEYEF